MAQTGVTYRATVAIAPDADRLAQMAAEAVVAAASEAAESFGIALSGGSTPRGLYALLASESYRGRIPWDRTHVFFADERCVPPDHADSNYGTAYDLLLSHVPVAEANVHRMVGESCTPRGAAQEYELCLAIACPFDADIPVLDVVVLGIGEDGHTASLFPGTGALDVMDRWVVANHVPHLDARRLTLTFPVLAAARQLIFLVSGGSKAAVVRRVAAGDPSLPAGRALALNARSTLMLDTEAASQLG